MIHGVDQGISQLDLSRLKHHIKVIILTYKREYMNIYDFGNNDFHVCPCAWSTLAGQTPALKHEGKMSTSSCRIEFNSPRNLENYFCFFIS